MAEPFLGIVRVGTPFARVIGDAANTESWSFPTKIKTFEKATSEIVVKTSNNYAPDFIEGWIELIQLLIDEGAVAVITSCGFLAAIHPLLRERFPGVPIGTSSLLQIPIASNLIAPGKRLGIVTFDAEVLGEKHLKGAGVDYVPPIVGIKKGSSFHKLITECAPYQFEEHKRDVVEAAKELVSKNNNIGGIILECANMGPFRAAVKKETGLPVWDIISLGNFVYDVGLARTFID